MTVSIGGVDVLSTLRNRGKGYTFHPQMQRVSGTTIYSYGEQWAEWTWRELQQTEWDWLRTQYAAAPTTFVLWDDNNTETSFTAGIMYRPTYGYISGGLYYEVKVEFHMLMPLQT